MKTLVEKLLYGGGVFFDLTKWLIFAVIVLVLINTYWISIFLVDGLSMEPSLHDNELVLMDKSFYRGGKEPKRGEAVIVQYPGDPEKKKYVKRVIGLPNERLKIANGRALINDRLLIENYLPFSVGSAPDGEWNMDQNEYFLMGDNRPNSNDSRYFGPVEKRFFIGKALLILFPHLRAIELPSY